MPFKYQVALLGSFAPKQARFLDILFARIDDLGIDRAQISIIEEAFLISADSKSPLVAVFFGYPGAHDAAHPGLAGLLRNSITIVPCVDAGSHISHCIPK